MKTVRGMDELVALVEGLRVEGKRAFVRWSKSPVADCRRGASTNWQTGRDEAGLSCNPLTPESWWLANGRTAAGWVEMQVRDYSYMRFQNPGARAWVLTGTEVGRGSDNEPLVADAAPVAWIAGVYDGR